MPKLGHYPPNRSPVYLQIVFSSHSVALIAESDGGLLPDPLKKKAS
jgi:hypothetical protein